MTVSHTLTRAGNCAAGKFGEIQLRPSDAWVSVESERACGWRGKAGGPNIDRETTKHQARRARWGGWESHSRFDGWITLKRR